MTTFALIHGAWGSGWHWASVPDRLRAMGHQAIAPDLPIEDPRATFDDYAAVVLKALEDVEDDVVLAAFSLGGLTAPLVAARRPVREIVYVAAVLCEPGRSLTDQLDRGDRMFRPEYLAGIEPLPDRGGTRFVDLDVYRQVAYDDSVAEPVVRERFERLRAQRVHAFGIPCAIDAMPDVPARYVLCTEDRLMDNDFWRDAVPARLGIEPVELPSGHSPIVSRPDELVRLLTAGAPVDVQATA